MDNFVREVERLYYKEKYSIRQVASILNCSHHKVKNCLHSQLHGPRSHKEACRNRTTDEYSKKLHKAQLGENNNQVVLNAEAVLEIRKLYEQALQEGLQKTATQYYLANKFNVKRPTISDIVLRKTWKHI